MSKIRLKENCRLILKFLFINSFLLFFFWQVILTIIPNLEIYAWPTKYFLYTALFSGICFFTIQSE